MKRLVALALAGLMAFPAPAQAAAWCADETVTRVWWNGENVMLQTDKTCLNFCQFSATSWSAESVSRAYSLLLTAMSTGRKMDFYWLQATTDCQASDGAFTAYYAVLK